MVVENWEIEVEWTSIKQLSDLIEEEFNHCSPIELINYFICLDHIKLTTNLFLFLHHTFPLINIAALNIYCFVYNFWSF